MKNEQNTSIYMRFRTMSLYLAFSTCLASSPAFALISNTTPSKFPVRNTTVAANITNTTASPTSTAISTAIVRYPTPSKIAVRVTRSTANTAAALPASITPPQNPQAGTQTPAVRHPTPSKKPISENARVLAQQTPGTLDSPSRDSIPLLQASIASVSTQTQPAAMTDSRRQNTADALRAFLSAPSKTPIASLQAQTVRSSNLPLEITASSVLIVDQDTREVLYSKNAMDILPIASITKLMTAMVVLDANQSMSERITISQADVDTLRNSSSRLVVGTRLTRRELLHLTLMSSENRAAHALARNYPGGTQAFVAAMNNKARALGMTQTTYADPTGLSNLNRSSARDLVWLVKAAYNYDAIRRWSTSSGYRVTAGRRQLNYINSNRLTDDPGWRIGLQKTGYIREAGHCLVMQTTVSGRNIIMVFLDANGSDNRLADAEKLRQLVRTQTQQYANAGRAASM